MMTGWILVCITLIRVGATFQFSEQETPQPSQATCEEAAADWLLKSRMSDKKVKGGVITYNTRCDYRR